MHSFRAVLQVLNTMKDEGVIEDYAIADAIALAFWTEPVATYDLDVLVFLPARKSALLSLDPIYRWVRAHSYRAREEHVLIEGVPTQFVPSPNELSDEAISSAKLTDYEGVPVRVVRPEYLVALYLQPGARTAKRRERAAALLELPGLKRAELDEILNRYGLSFDRRPARPRQRPGPELLRSLREGKGALRRKRRAMPLPEKIRQVLALQRLQHPLLARQRSLRSWEQPWDVEP